MPCSVVGLAVTGLGTLYVPGGPAFGDAAEVPAATMWIDGGGRFVAELSGGGVFLEVEVDAAAPVHLRDTRPLHRYLLVSPAADLVVSDDRGLRVAPPAVGDGVGPTVFVAEEAPGARVRCGDLTLSRAGPGASPAPTEAAYRLDTPGHRLVLRHTPGGAVLGTLPAGVVGVVHRRRGDDVRATVDLGAGLAVRGWFEDVHPVPVEIGDVHGSAAQAIGAGQAYTDVTRCAGAMALAVEVDGVVTRIGSAAPGTPVIAIGPARDDGWTAIVLPEAWFSPWDGRVSARTGATLLGPGAIRACPRDPASPE